MNLAGLLLLLYVGNVVILALNLVWFFSVMRKEKQVALKSSGLLKEQDELMTEAQKKASSLLHGTADKAAELLRSVEVDREEIAKDFRGVFERTEAEHQKQLITTLKQEEEAFATLLEAVRSEVSTHLSKQMSGVAEESNALLQGYVEALKSGTIELEKKVQAQLQTAIEELHEDVTNYRAEQLELVDKQISLIVANVASKVLRHAIPVEEHERMIMEALERAKKDALLTFN